MKTTYSTIAMLLAISAGCVSNGTTSLKSGLTSSTAAIATKAGETGRVVKGQMNTMGTAVGSAFTKTKSMVTNAFTSPLKMDESDPTALSDKPPTIGAELYVASAANYEFAKNFDKANEAYSKALEVEPSNVAALIGSARLAARQGNQTRAIEMYQRAESVDSRNTAIYTELAQIYSNSGDLAKARVELQKAVNLEPENKGHRQKLAGILLDQGQATDALNEMQQVETPAMANYQIAFLYASRKNIPVAQQYLQTALQIDPNLQPARDLMGSLQNSAFAQQAYGSYQQASQVYQGVNNFYQQAGTAFQQATAVMSTAPALPNQVSR